MSKLALTLHQSRSNLSHGTTKMNRRRRKRLNKPVLANSQQANFLRKVRSRSAFRTLIAAGHALLAQGAVTGGGDGGGSGGGIDLQRKLIRPIQLASSHHSPSFPAAVQRL